MWGTTSTGRGTRAVLTAAIAAGALLLGACSSVSDSSTKAGDTSTVSAAQKAVLDAGYGGDGLKKPTAAGPAAQKGKKVWAISCGEAYQACALLSSSYVEAGRALGWNVNLVDGKADPSVATGLIRQAVAARADGIAVFGFDCPGIKSGLQSAKAAGIPVVQFTSVDCDDSAFGSGQALFTAGVSILGSQNIKDYYLKWSAARAQYVAALMGGKGKLLEIADTDQRAQQYSNQGFEDEFKKACPACKLVKVPFTFSQVPREATAKWTSALMQNPDATAVATGIDSLMGLGLQSALKQASFHGIVAGGEGLNLDLVRQGVQGTETVMPYGLISWGLADTLNRLFAGEKPADLPSEGGGWQFLDKDHNLPAAGKPWEPPFDYRQVYRAMWQS